MKIKIVVIFLLLIFLIINQNFAQETDKKKYTQLIEKVKNLPYGHWKSMTGQFKNAGDEIYEPLTQLLRKEETGDGAWRRIEWNQRKVAWILGDINTEKSADYLIKMIQDTTLNLWGRIDAASALGWNKTQKAVDVFLRLFKDKKNDPQLRRSTARALGDLKVEKSVPLLRAALDENINLLDMGVLYALGKIGNNEAIEALFYALDCVVYYNRTSVYNSLRKLSPEKESDLLIKALDDNYWGVREDAVKILKEKGTTVSDQLCILVENKKKSETVRWEAIRILSSFNKPDHSELFLKSLYDSEWMIRNEAVVALTKIKSEITIESLIKMLEDKNGFVKEEAAWILGEMKSEEAVKPLINLLKDKENGWIAAVSLGKIGAEASVKPLIKALQDDYIKKRRAAAWALEKLKSEKSVAALKKALKDKDEEVRTLAALGLENLNIQN